LRYLARLSVEHAAETMGLPLFKACARCTYAKASLHLLLDLDSNGCSSQFFHILLDESAAFVAWRGEDLETPGS